MTWDELTEQERNSLNEQLLSAVVRDDATAIKLLVKLGADVDAMVFETEVEERGVKREERGTPLYLATFLKRTAAAAALIESGADVDKQTTSFKNTPLHAAAFKGAVDITKLLLAVGANINIPDEDGFTPLHDAKGYRQIQHLLRVAANDTSRNPKPEDLALNLQEREAGLEQKARRLRELERQSKLNNTFDAPTNNSTPHPTMTLEEIQERIIRDARARDEGI